ncbi:MAG TPA: glycosyltransferase, partial [Pirellula sp.]|nr:glycosyltransferase [Pirellula sp.]
MRQSLEQLRNPGHVLANCHHWLKTDGSLVVSVQNIRHHSVVRGLVDGNWSYEPDGLLDEAHARCMTRRELQKLLFRSGYQIDVLEAIPGDGYREWQQSGCPGNLDFGRIQITGLTTDEAEEFFVFQYLAKASKIRRPEYGLTSIIIVTHNQLAYTELCISSIIAKTDGPYEFVFVDNASTDGTLDYLRSISGAKVISNSENRGFAPAVNQGIQFASGKQILLLNNDTVVTTGWLEGLLESLYDRPDTGLVGPVSNNVSGPQKIAVTYSELTSLDGFAWDLRVKRKLTETDRLVGFCILLRRSVIDDIGLFDEQFRVGGFEDDDLCRRAIDAGYKV